MTLNVILEMLWIRVWCGYEEQDFRERKEGVSDWFFYAVLFFPFVLDMNVFCCSSRPDLFSMPVQSVIKSIGIAGVILSRNLIFKTGIWSTMVCLAFADVACGAAIIIRYILFRIFGISVAQFEKGDFRILPILTICVAGAIIHFTVFRWVKKYKKYAEHPNLLLKIMVIFYWVPCLFVIRPMDMIDVMENSIAVVISCITVLAVMAASWIGLILRRRAIMKENHYLEIQTELFQEHNQILNEQIVFIEKCKGYFQNDQTDNASLDELRNRMEEVRQSYYTGSDLLNTVMQNKEKRCRELKIDLKVEMGDFKLPPNISEIDFLTIFYNLFDNSMEAASQCIPANRNIHINSFIEAGKLHFNIENGTTGKKALPSGFFTTKTDTKNHGFGLRIVKEMVEKNHGELFLEDQEQRFCARVVLPVV